jgi:diguanylate cyclase (GGDEF)-like protein
MDSPTPTLAPTKRRTTVAIVILIGLLAACIELLIVRSYLESARITSNFSKTVDSTTFLANVQREFYLYDKALRTSTPGRWDSGDAAERRIFLNRQVDLLMRTSDSPGFVSSVKVVRAKLERVNSLVRSPFGGTPAAHQWKELDRRLVALELQIKKAFDKEETLLFGTMADAVKGREKSQRFLVVLGGFVFLVTSVVVGAWSRSIRSRLTTAYNALVAEVEERKLLQEKLAHQAFHDVLTDLPNRALFRNDLDKALARAGRGRDVGVLYLDLDDFKAVNDDLGHDAGDSLLGNVAKALRGSIRASDTPARLGGDEFAVVLDDVASVGDAIGVADRLLLALAAIEVGGSGRRVRASVGIALSGETARDADDLLRNADAAMYEAKQSGKNAFRVYDPSRPVTTRGDAFEQEVARALQEDELVLHYQPIVSLPERETQGFEALLRWDHPERGMLQPGDFIGLAEERGLMPMLDAWVLREACRQLAEWKQHPAFEPLFVAVNISAGHFESVALVDEVEDALGRAGLSASCLRLEVTETMLTKDKAAAAETLGRLRDLGVSVALDDFGTGYSSLGYLREMTIDILKIDRSFVAGIATRPTDEALAGVIIDLAQTLGLEVVAEGIENELQERKVLALGCKTGQGYLFGRPQPAHAIEQVTIRETAKSVHSTQSRICEVALTY